jgi:3-hydroxyethyl bacteriochlorophyllide a dehydrogenase
MVAVAVVLNAPRELELRRVHLSPRAEGDVTVDIEWSAISTGTEKLLWNGQMPPFPGMGYPLVPGYESVGRVVEADESCGVRVGDRVFVPGASCFQDLRGLFGGAASRLVVPASRVTGLDSCGVAEEGVLLALAATAQHALKGGDGRPAELIVGHGVLGRLLARLAVAAGGSPVVWEVDPRRAEGADGYRVLHPEDDQKKDYKSIYDVSGDGSLVDRLVARLARGGELVLAGFYEKIGFAFPPAFMREARFRVAAEFQRDDVQDIVSLLAGKKLSLAGLITHRKPYDAAAEAYATAFNDRECLKMLIDWRSCK